MLHPSALAVACLVAVCLACSGAADPTPNGPTPDGPTPDTTAAADDVAVDGQLEWFLGLLDGAALDQAGFEARFHPLLRSATDLAAVQTAIDPLVQRGPHTVDHVLDAGPRARTALLTTAAGEGLQVEVDVVGDGLINRYAVTEVDPAAFPQVVAGQRPVDPDIDALEAALLTAADVGADALESTWRYRRNTGPCGVVLDDDLPPVGVVGTLAITPGGSLAQQEVRGHADAAAAQAAFAASRDALSCGADAADPGVQLSEPTDVDGIGVPAYRVDLTVGGVAGTIVVALVDDLLVSTQVQQPDAITDAVDLTALAVERLGDL